jgi:hypothetical protein
MEWGGRGHLSQDHPFKDRMVVSKTPALKQTRLNTPPKYWGNHHLLLIGSAWPNYRRCHVTFVNFHGAVRFFVQTFVKSDFYDLGSLYLLVRCLLGIYHYSTHFYVTVNLYCICCQCKTLLFGSGFHTRTCKYLCV